MTSGHIPPVSALDFMLPPLLLTVLLCVSLFLAVLGLCCCTQPSSSCSEQGLLSSCYATASHYGGFSCGAQARECAGSVLVARRRHSSGSQSLECRLSSGGGRTPQLRLSEPRAQARYLWRGDATAPALRVQSAGSVVVARGRHSSSSQSLERRLGTCGV